ncbi:hypothetical protein CRV01_01330 [Arcobacter sp. CECT 8983]|uniref:hypothetical protein n=1 Tax=Arcobacter sp. CECT 8983 TaxID=2044508 RepID=UPI00100AE849|nr:hypothetical protein [Arcobacter sp. CECT 8983]RXJ91761.1 hypothetical protein CRV01_01330 [Arcobacter sp. CECT 8983]
MIKNLLLAFILVFIFSGCFSFSSLNPFSDEEKTQEEVKPTQIPMDAPKWVKEPKEENAISIVAFSYIKDGTVKEFDKKRTLLIASNKLSKKIYLKTIEFYKEYEQKLDNPMTFDQDLKSIAEQISLKAVSKSKIKNSWLSNDNRLFVKLSVDSDFVATQIQNESKHIYKVDKTLYKNILSNRAKALLINYLEK